MTTQDDTSTCMVPDEGDYDGADNSTSDLLEWHESLTSLTQSPFALQSSLKQWHTSSMEELLRKKKKKKGKKNKKKKRPVLRRHVSPSSPSRHNRFLTPLGYTQFYLPLHKINKHDGWGPTPPDKSDKARPLPGFEVEYVTSTHQQLAKLALEMHKDGRELSPMISELIEDDDDHVKLTDKLEKLENNLAPYSMSDLTIQNWLKLAKKLASDDKAWKGFEKRIYVSSHPEEEL